jgi:hypothetical protein
MWASALLAFFVRIFWQSVFDTHTKWKGPLSGTHPAHPYHKKVNFFGTGEAETLLSERVLTEFLFDTEQYGMHGDHSQGASPGRLLRSKIR